MSESYSHFWYVSPLTRRILAVNVAALLVLVLGLLYTGKYEEGLLLSELNALTVKGQFFAAALAEGGVRPTLSGDPLLAEDLSRAMLRKLVVDDGTRIVVFGKTGKLILDSRQLLGPGGLVQIVALEPPFESWSLPKKIDFFLEKVLTLLPGRLVVPYFPQELTQDAQSYPGVLPALRGEVMADAWRAQDGGILLSAATPVQNLKNVLGAVFILHDGKSLEDAVRRVQFTVFRAFLAALLATILLSIYLSETIVRPIVRLAEAAEKVRESLLMRDTIPDLSYRGDEIGDLSRSFRDMAHALSGRIDSIDRFAADVAHEIKNPLASVKSAVETFALVKDAAQRDKLIAVIHDDVNRINRLINDISHASRLDSALSLSERATFDLGVLLKNVITAEDARAGAVGKVVLYLEEGRRLPVTGNEAQLAQVACNLIENALSFVTGEGKVVVSAGLKGDKIFIHFDNAGPPIPESKLEAVFERFYSERPKTEKFGLHSGLGLSISRQIVRTHHGEISAHNLKDKAGTPRAVRFTVILPAGAGTK
jgi:two-component system sensor histidine kinase ChvG